MNKTEKKRQHLEALYLQYRAGKICLNDVLYPSMELDTMICKIYSSKDKVKQIAYKTPY